MPRPSRFTLRVAAGLCVTLSLALAALLLPGHATRAAEIVKYGNSLDWVPAEASFYSSLLRNKEQLDIIANSKVWAKFTSLSSVRQAWQSMQMVMSLPGTPFAAVQQALQQPENRQLLELSGDLASNEIVCYGDLHAVETWELASRAYNVARYSSAFSGINGPNSNPNPIDQQRKVQYGILQMLASNVDKIETPTFVVGFKHSNAEPVKAQLARLEKLVTDNIEAVPQLKGRFERAKVGSAAYLVLKLDGQMIPWDQLQIKQLETKPGEFDALVEKVKRLKLVVAIGIRDDYLLVAVGPSTDHLAALGSGKLLVSRPEFQPLAKFAGQRLTGINYASKECRVAEGADFGGNAGNIEGLFDVIRGALPTTPLPKETQERIGGDLDKWSQKMTAATQRLGPEFGFSFLTARGTESYSYDWSETQPLDGSKRLDLLEHVGGTPLVAAVSRAKYSPDNYREFVEILKTAHRYFEELAVPQMQPDDQRQYRDIMEFAKPLLVRLDAATGSMLLPGLADGQIGFVLDAKLTSERWCQQMPRSSAPLPILEPALVFGVSDADLVKRAFGEYRIVADAIIEKIKQTNPQALPADFKLPDPQIRETKNGSIYSFPFPKDLGLDPQLALNAGLSKRVAVLSIAPKHTTELLTPTTFEAEGPAGDTKRQLASAAYLDWASVVEASTPWIDYAVHQRFAARNGEDGGAGAQQNSRTADGLRSTLAEVHSFLEVLQVLRTVSSATYLEGKALITHTEMHYRDVQ